VHVDASVVLVHDAVGQRQAQAGAAADRLGRQEGIEDARQLVWRDAAAVVLHLDPDLVPGVAAAHDDQAALRADRMGRVDEASCAPSSGGHLIDVTDSFMAPPAQCVEPLQKPERLTRTTSTNDLGLALDRSGMPVMFQLSSTQQCIANTE
jgi:hypothetical protein